MTKAEYEHFSKIWDAGNDAGDGFPVGNETETIDAAIVTEGHTIIDRNYSGAPLVVAERPDGTRYIVCDANGPWGVELPRPE